MINDPRIRSKDIFSERKSDVIPMMRTIQRCDVIACVSRSKDLFEHDALDTRGVAV
jgi:hypothetical protein